MLEARHRRPDPTTATRARRSAMLGALVGLLGFAGSVTGGSVATAQGVPTPRAGDERVAIDDCIAEQVDAGKPEGVATRGCVPDPERFGDCMQEQLADETPAEEALNRCIGEQASDSGSTTSEPVATDPGSSSTTPADPAQPDASDTAPASGLGTGPVVLIGIAALAIGVGLGFLAARMRNPSGSMPATPHPTGIGPPLGSNPETAPVASSPVDDGSRSRLVAAIIDAIDLVSSDAVKASLAQDLAAVGVERIVVTPGTPFDPTVHRGVDATDAPDQQQDGLVARTDRVGWADRGTVLRPPEVVVNRWDGP